jgi:hypothetical protein
MYLRLETILNQYCYREVFEAGKRDSISRLGNAADGFIGYDLKFKVFLDQLFI